MTNFYDYIEDYVLDKLSEADRKDFEVGMKADDKLKAETEAMKIAMIIGEGAYEEDVRKVVEDEIGQKKKLPKYILVIGVLLLIMLASYFINSKFNLPKYEYAANYTDPAWPKRKAGVVDSLELAISIALNGNYKLGISQIKQLSLNDTLKRYWITELHSKQGNADSILYYAPSIDTDNIKRDRILYLRILAYIKQGKNEEVQNAIQTLPEDFDHWYLERLK